MIETAVAAAQRSGRGRAVRGPLAVAAGVVLATGYIALVDPNEGGHYPACPLKATTGLDCPGCGGLRCVHALARGDLSTAADQNLLAVLVLPLLVVAWAGWLWRRAGGRGIDWPRWLLPAVLWVALAFTVVRNIPGVDFLGSGAG